MPVSYRKNATLVSPPELDEASLPDNKCATNARLQESSSLVYSPSSIRCIMESSSERSSVQVCIVTNGAAEAFASSTKIFPAVGVTAGLPHHALNFFVVDEAEEAAHAMPFDERNHVIFETRKVVGG